MTLNGVMAVTLRYFTEFGKPAFQDMYTVNHKKRDILFFTITSANLNRFYSFYIILIVMKFYKRLL